MRINFDKQIQNYNIRNPKANLNKSKLARGLVVAEFYKSEVSALNMMRMAKKGECKTFSWDMLKWLALYFKVKGRELIEFDDEEKEPTVSDVAPSIRDDAPGLKKN